MRRIQILTFVFLAISMAVAYYLFNSLRTSIIAQDEIEQLERTVVEKLQMIRKAQKFYRSTHGAYANHWDSLVQFVEEGILYATTRHERIITLDYGADSIEVKVDTIGSIAVRDSLFKKIEYPNFDPKLLPFMPHAEEQKFTLFTDTIERNSVLVNVIEVMDAAPTNPKRNAENEYRSLQPLHFGSRVTVSLSGNWE